MTGLLLAPLVSGLLCGCVWWLASRWRWLDEPNGRSSHGRATPHGGGIGILLAFVAVLVLESPWAGSYLQLPALALGLMLLGALDDRYSLPVVLRLGRNSLRSSVKVRRSAAGRICCGARLNNMKPRG